MKRRGWVFSGLLLIFVVLFHQSILTYLATWSLQGYSYAKWGKSLRYEKAFVEDHQLVMIKPQFGGDASFIAERVALDFHANFWKRQLDVEINIDQPYWHFKAPLASQWERFERLLTQEDRWIKTHPRLHIKEGTLSWLLENKSHQVKFDLELNNQEGGYLKLDFAHLGSQSQSLVLETVKASHGVEMACQFETLRCPSLIALVQLLGIELPPWVITSGFVEGKLRAVFPKKHRPYLEGELLIKEFSFHGLESELKGHIQIARLKLDKNEKSYELNHTFFPIVGKFEVLKPSSLSYHSPLQDWEIHQIVGSIQLDDVENALINFEAEGGNFHHPSKWSLQGKANLNSHHSFGLDLTLACSSRNQPEGKIHLALHPEQAGSNRMNLQCEKLSYSECGFLQTLLATRWPVFNEVILEEGELNASIEAHLVNQGMGELSVKKFEAFRLKSRVKPWNLSCHFTTVKGLGSMHLGQENSWDTLKAALHLEGGKVLFEDLNPPLPMTDIEAHLFVKQGTIDHSLVTLQVAGLKGKMDVEWGDQKQLLTFKLDGTVQDLSELFPDILQEGIHKHFYHNRMMVLANLKRQNQQIDLGGTLHIQRDNTAPAADLVHFGCEFKRTDVGEDSKYVPIGWFHAQKLPLEKYLSPFIFRKGILFMSGEGEFKGSFDDRFLSIKYDADDLVIQNDDLRVEVPHLHASTPGQLVGLHKVDLRTHSYQGTLPFSGASYFEKNTGLVFHDIQGLISFQKGLIHIEPIEAQCEGIYFGGELELDYRDPAPGVFDLKLTCPSISGKISQIQHILAHIEQSSLLHKIPLEGEVSGKGNGLQLKFSFIPQDYDLKASVKGVVNQGDLILEGADMALKEIYMDVDYDHQRQLLEFSDIQGSFLVGKPRRVEEYLFTGPYIRIHQMNQPNIDLDVAIKDKGYELLRLVGHTEDEEEGIKSIHLDSKLSHFSDIHPSQFVCQLRDWSNIEKLDFRSTFDLNQLFQDLKRFRQTGFFFLSHSIIDKISHFLPLQGQGALALNYLTDGSYSYLFEGAHIKQGNSSEHFGLIKGSKQDKKWIVDQLQWDDWSAYAELHQMDEKWRIPTFGLKVGQSLLLGMEGDWLQEKGALKAKLKFCQIDLSKLDDFSPMKSFVAKWWPKGTLNATGDIEWNLLAPNSVEGFQANLTSGVNNLTLRSCPFKVLNDFRMKVKPHHYIRLEDVQLELKEQSFINIDHFDYQISNESIQSLAASFQIPYQQLELIGETFHHHFPDILEPSAKDLIVSSKQEDELRGVLSIENPSSGQSFCRLRLDDGVYTFKHRKYDLKNIQLEISDDMMKFKAHTQEERFPFQIKGEATWPFCELGECQLIGLNGSKPLLVKWKNPIEGRFGIRSIVGDFAGCSFALDEENYSSSDNDWNALQGYLSIDFNQLSTVLAQPIADTIQKMKIGSLYAFNGKFWINPEGGSSFLETISLKGKLTSKDPILKGYQLKSLESEVQYTPGRLDIQNLSIEDPAGNIKAANSIVVLDRSKNDWTFFIPRLTMRDFRPSLLRDTENYAQANSKFRSLVLKKVELHNLKGNLDSIHTWEGEGNLQFLNSSRKSALHPIFVIPAEIILRLGLDPHVLNPVSGFIDFSLQGNRFYLKRFKDVYSEGKGSRFYLVGPDPSWVDFDGNLSVNIRMKQYNLIFKIAELFTVSIQGNIKKPSYNLQKQSRGSRKELKQPAAFMQ